MRKVEPRKQKLENPTVRKFKLGVRNFLNKYTGQDELIEKYNAATFNPYTPMQKKALRAKIAQLYAAMQELGISR